MSKYVIFGAGKLGKRYYDIATREGLEIAAFCDNDETRWGSQYCGKVIISPDMLLNQTYREYSVFVAMRHPEEVYEQLDALGIVYGSDIKAEIILKKHKLFFETDIQEPWPQKKPDNPRLSIVIDARSCTTADLQKCIASVQSGETEYGKEIVVWEKGMACPEVYGDFVFLLEGSSLISVGSLAYLAAKSEQGKCLLGAKEIDSRRKIIQAGFVLKDETLTVYGENENSFADKYSYVKEVACLKNNGMMMPREQWDLFRQKMVNGKDEVLACVEMQQEALAQGYRLQLQPYALLLSDRETAKVWNEKVIECWKSYPVVKQYVEKEQVLMLDESIAAYDTNAGHRTTHSYIQLLMELGKEIVYLLEYLDATSPYLEYYQQLGVHVVYDEKYNSRSESYLSSEVQNITYAFINRPNIADKYVPVLRKYPDMTIVHYGHDLHYLRLLREYELTQNEKKREEAARMKKIEFSLVNQVDYTGYPSDVEVDILKKEFPDANIQCFPMIYFDKFPIISEHNPKRGMLFVGGFGHTPNVDAACWLVEEILPEIRKRGITDKLYLVGSNPTEKIYGYACDDVIVTGYVTEQELAELYANCRVAIAPLRYGAGMKGKVLEAMYYGIPLVTTDIGAEGLKGVERVIGIGNTVTEIVDRVEGIWGYGEKELVDLAHNTQKYVRERFDKEKIKAMLLKQMKGK